MSTYYDIACLDCRTEMGCHDIRNEEALSFIAATHAAFARIQDHWAVETTVQVNGCTIPHHWLEKHIGHRVAVKCEYENLDECAVRTEARMTYEAYRDRDKGGA